MDFKPIVDAVSKFSPLIGTVVGGPAGGLVGSIIANVFGGSLDDPIDLAHRITADPDAQNKLLEMHAVHYELLKKLANEDVENARDREVKITEATHTRDWVPSILALGFLIIYASIQFYIITKPSDDSDIISARVQDIIMLIIGYYFGNSHTHIGNDVPRRT